MPSLIGWLNLGSSAGDRRYQRVNLAVKDNTITKIFTILRFYATACIRENHETCFTSFGPIDVLIGRVKRMAVTTMVPGSRQEQHYPDEELLMVRMPDTVPRICVQPCAHLRRDADAQLRG